jgi:hypothetical protein
MDDPQGKFDDIVRRLSALPEPQKRIGAFERIRDIPYGNIGSRNPYDVLMANQGTCSGKHALLKLVLEALGYEVQSWFARHDFRRFPIHPWPPELREFQEMTLPDYHDFLKVHIDERWVTIDAIFDPPLKNLGFPVQDWNGISEMQLPIVSEEIFPAEGAMEDHKQRLIGALPANQQADRKKFLETLTAWLQQKRKS